MLELLELAGKIALPTNDNDLRNFYLGAIGVRRNDGVLVRARNGAVRTNHKENQKIGLAHAEIRLARKLDYGSTIYVARIRRLDGQFAMARPCGLCQNILRARGVERCYYTVNESQFGVYYVAKDSDRVFDC